MIFRDRGRSKWAEFLLLSVTPDSLRSSIPCSTSTFSKSSPLPLPWEWPELWPPSHGSDSDNNVPMTTYIYTITHFTRTRTHINSRISSLSPLIVFFVLQLKLIISKLTFFLFFFSESLPFLLINPSKKNKQIKSIASGWLLLMIRSKEGRDGDGDEDKTRKEKRR